MHYTDVLPNGQYGVNPYALENNSYARSKTDNPARYLNHNPSQNNNANNLNPQLSNRNENNKSVNYDIYELDDE